METEATYHRTPGHISQGHGVNCYCGKTAKWHIRYNTGCGHVCGIHKNSLVRILDRRSDVRVKPLADPK